MKIHNSTEYIEEQEYLQLSVINKFDFSTPIHCYEMNNGYLISYCVKKWAEGNGCMKSEIVALTEEMKSELLKMGYKLTKN